MGHTSKRIKRSVTWRRPPTPAQLVDYYIKSGFWLLKIKPDTKQPEGSWQDKPKPAREEVLGWLAEGFGLGVAHGSRSGNTVAIDIDEPKLYEQIFPEGDWEQKTLVVNSSKTKKGTKRHLIFRTARPVHSQHLAHKGIAIDIIGEGNYTCLPPTPNPKANNEPYEFAKIPPEQVMAWDGDFTDDFTQRLIEKVGYKPVKEEVKVGELFLPRSEGDRHFWLIRIVTWLKLCEVTKKTAWEQVVAWNRCNDPPIETAELQYQFNDVWNKPLTLIQFDQRPTEYFSEEIMQAAEKALIENPLQTAVDAVHELHTGDDELIKLDYISALSAKIADPTINTWAIGTSQTGKSHMKYSVLQATQPKDYYEIFTSASPMSLFYYAKAYGEDAFDGLTIFIDEVESSEHTLPVLRSLTGQTEITPRHLSVNDAEVMDLKITGKRTVWFTSVKAFGTEQLRNRFLFENPDESTEQSLNIAELQAKRYFHNQEKDKAKMDTAKAMTSLIVNETRDLSVTFPYGWTWSLINYRYLLPIFISMLKVVTKINYRQRKRDENGALISEPADFETVKRIWQAIEKEILYRVNKKCQVVFDALPDEELGAVTVPTLAMELGKTTDWIRKQLEILTECDLINADKDASDRTWKYWKADVPKVSDIQLSDKAGIEFITETEKTEKTEKIRFFEGSRENENSN
jgi:hypothetical protein